jgi:hypothetical protein
MLFHYTGVFKDKIIKIPGGPEKEGCGGKHPI